MLDYPALAALAEILRSGSFETAAARLGVTPSAVSQRIRALEERMGAVLVHRGPPATGTEAGLRLAHHLEQVRLLEQGLDPGGAAPVLRLAVNADSLATWLMPALTALPVLFDLVIDDQDHAQDWLRRGEVSAAITAGAGAVPGCDRVRLGALRYLPTARADRAAEWFAGGVTAAALARAPALVFNAKDALQARWVARAVGRPVALPAHRIPDPAAFVAACRLGLGWGMNPEPLVAPDVAAGRLVVLGAPLDVVLDWQVMRQVAPRLKPLTEAVRAAARDVLRPAGQGGTGQGGTGQDGTGQGGVDRPAAWAGASGRSV